MAMTELERAKRCRIFKNGDPTFTGKDVVLSKRTAKSWENFLQTVTYDISSDEAVRRICTPVGGSEVFSLDQIQDKYNYVAVGRAPFKNIGYLNLTNQQPPKFSVSPRVKGDEANQDLKPIQTSPRLQHVPGRCHNIPTDATNIYVYANGQGQEPAQRVVIPDRFMQSMEGVLEEVNHKIHMGSGAVRSLYTLDGEMIHHPNQLENKAAYVAVDYRGFKNITYGSSTRPVFYVPTKIDSSHQWWNENDPTAGRMGALSRRRTDPIPSIGKSSSVSSTTSDMTDKRSFNLRKSYPGSTGQLHNQLNARLLEHRSNANLSTRTGPFYGKSSTNGEQDKQQFRVVDYDKDDGGVFKAKQMRRETRGAAEIKENRETMIDVPVDNLPAQQIDDEEIEGEYNKTARSNKQRTAVKSLQPPAEKPVRKQTPYAQHSGNSDRQGGGGSFRQENKKERLTVQQQLQLHQQKLLKQEQQQRLLDQQQLEQQQLQEQQRKQQEQQQQLIEQQRKQQEQQQLMEQQRKQQEKLAQQRKEQEQQQLLEQQRKQQEQQQLLEKQRKQQEQQQLLEQQQRQQEQEQLQLQRQRQAVPKKEVKMSSRNRIREVAATQIQATFRGHRVRRQQKGQERVRYAGRPAIGGGANKNLAGKNNYNINNGPPDDDDFEHEYYITEH